MKETKEMDNIHRNALKQYHALCAKLGMSQEEREALLAGYGVESSRDLDTHDLVDLCGKLSAQAHRKGSELDKMRKRVMAAIGAWLRSERRLQGIDVIKGIACRATGYADFNEIPRERLRNLIYLFNNKTRDREQVEELTAPGAKIVAMPLPAAKATATGR